MFTGSWEWLIILSVVLLLFGGSKLPKLGGALGESIRNFRKGLKEGTKSYDETTKELKSDHKND
ncbi:MAG: twin-arginine translocase TatA/TatE family subunit [Proteobacteria bacterium]|nr:twin-arginine translocase TatA/TatE family subunit [Pseudomonadota bacterium]